MDEIVFTREQLRRSLKTTSDHLALAAEHYEGEDTIPLHDSLACASLAAVGQTIREYIEAVGGRVSKLGVHVEPSDS